MFCHGPHAPGPYSPAVSGMTRGGCRAGPHPACNRSIAFGSAPFRSVLPCRPAPTAGPLFARIARARLCRRGRPIRAGAVRAPDCPRARQKQDTPLLSVSQRFFRAGASRKGKRPRADAVASLPAQYRCEGSRRQAFLRKKSEFVNNNLHTPNRLPSRKRGSPRPPNRGSRSPAPVLGAAPDRSPGQTSNRHPGLDPRSIPDPLRPPQPFETGSDRLRSPREPELDPGSSPG